MNWNINDNPNVLLLVAHPDDETIFCGGTLLYYPKWNWTIICLTLAKDTERYKEFQNALEYFKKLGVNITSYDSLEQVDKLENGGVLTEQEEAVWINSVKNLALTPDLVITHNTAGEYGHPHHKSVSKISHNLFNNVWEFICPGATNVSPQPYKANINTVPLSRDILNKKVEIYNRCYTSQLNNWWNLSDLMLYEFRSGPEIFTSD